MQKSEAPKSEVITRNPLPASRKIYVLGKVHDIKVAMREIELTDTVHNYNGNEKVEKNAPITVYDTSGPFTDPNIKIDLKKGLPRLREEWILNRGDVEELKEQSSEYGRKRLNDTSLDYLRFEHLKNPLKAKKGMNVSQMHYANQ